MTTLVEGGSAATMPLPSPLLEPWPEKPTRLRSYVNLTRELAVASFKLKYAGSVLGYIWSLVKPVMIFGMLYLVFAVFLLRGRTQPGENFPVQLLVGVVAWVFFSEATHGSLGAVVGNTGMIRKAYFPRWILVVASNLSSAMTLAVNMTLLLVLGLTLHWFHIGWQSLLVIPLLLELYFFALGLGFLLATFFVYFRDLGHIWDIVLQFLFYASGIIFPIRLLPPNILRLLEMNPVGQIVQDMRRALVTPAIPWSFQILGARIAVPILVTCGCVIAGGLVFHRLSGRFGQRL
jgi:ABC-2 type transport system permease protein